MAEITPRINALYLESFTGQTVRLVGKVQQLRGESAVVDAGGRVDVLLNRVGFLSSALLTPGIFRVRSFEEVA